MARISKRMQQVRKLIDRNRIYSPAEGIDLLLKQPRAKFVESVDVAVQLGIDATKSDQNVRGAVVLPAGTGRTVRVIVFAQGESAQQATEAGADVVGMDDLVARVKGGFMDFDVVIAMPDTMRVVGQLAKILGPRGLMPNPKVGTVTRDVATAVRNAKAGQVSYRNDKTGVVHACIGKVSFTPEQLQQNLQALLDALNRAKPATVKGAYIRKICVSTTMGGGLTLDRTALTNSKAEAAG